MMENAGIGARYYGIDFGTNYIADDGLGCTTSEHRFNLMSKIFERYAEAYSIIYEYDKLELNLWGVKDAEKKADGLQFGGYSHKISQESTHVGLQIVQNMKNSVTVNVNRRLAKTNSRTWQLMSKAWARHSHIHIQVHRELITSVT